MRLVSYNGSLFSMLRVLVAVAGAIGVAEAEEALWEGEIGHTAYIGDGGCGTKGSYVHSVVSPGGTPVAFPGNTTKIFKMELEESGGGDSSSDVSYFCERNIVGNASSHTRIDYTGCTMDGEGGIYFSLNKCSDELCSNCLSTPVFTGYMTFNAARVLYNNVGQCFEFVGLTVDEAQLATEESTVRDGDINSTIIVPSVFQTFDADTNLSDLRAYWNLMFGNSCAFSDQDVESFITGHVEATIWSERSELNEKELNKKQGEGASSSIGIGKAIGLASVVVVSFTVLF